MNHKEAMKQALSIQKTFQELKDCPVGETITLVLDDEEHTFHKIGRVSEEMMKQKKSFLG